MVDITLSTSKSDIYPCIGILITWLQAFSEFTNGLVNGPTIIPISVISMKECFSTYHSYSSIQMKICTMNNKEPKKDCPVSEYYILNNILRIIDLKSAHS